MRTRLLLALVLLTGNSLAITPKERLAALESAAASGDVDARRRLVRALRVGDGVPVDAKRAYAIATEHAAIDPEMGCILALRLRDGSVADGVVPDLDAATTAVQKAADDGSPLCRSVVVWSALEPDATAEARTSAERFLSPEPTEGPLAVVAAGATLLGRRSGDAAAARARLAALHAQALAAEDRYQLRLFGWLMETLDHAKVAREGLPSRREALEACARLDSVACMESLGSPLEDPKTTPWLERAVELGSAEAAGMLGFQRFYGLAGKEDEASGLALLASAARDGDPASIVSYARILVFNRPQGMSRQDANAEARRVLLPLKSWDADRAWYVLWVIDVQSEDPTVRREAYSLLERAAKSGNAESQADLGLEREVDGPLGPADLATSNRLYGLASEQGLSRASVYLANNLVRGHGSLKDPVRAESLYRAAILQGSTEAHFRLGMALAWGWLGRKAEVDAGRALLEKAASSGHAEAMVELGELALTGAAGTVDATSANDWFQKGADAGSGMGAFRLAMAYVEGTGVAPSPELALKWFGVAAEAGVPVARVRLGTRLLDGDGVPADPARGVALLEAAAKDGLDGAREALARAFIHGTGVTKDLPRGLALAREAAAAGSADALLLLGAVSERGLGVPKSASEARRLYVEAFEKGNAEAGLYGGSMLLYGLGGPKDLPQAIRLLSIAADDGYYLAQLRLGWCYIDGRGVPVDDARGVALVREAAEGGYADAQNDLAVLLQRGEPSAEQVAEAIAWLRKADAGGSPHGSTGLGKALLAGIGGPPDERAGVALLSKALAAGYGPAGTELAAHFLAQTPPRAEEARQALEAAIAAGDEDAIPDLADLHMTDGLLPDPVKWRHYLLKGTEAGHLGCIRVLIAEFPDAEAGPTALFSLASRGDSEAVLAVSELLSAGALKSVRERAVGILRKAAETSEPAHLLRFAGALSSQIDAPELQKEGCAMAERARAAGNTQSRCLIGVCQSFGVGIPRDVAAGGAELRACATTFPELAAESLLSLLRSGDLEPADKGEYGRLLQAAVAAGHDQFEYDLAVAKLFGYHEVQVDEETGAKMIGKLAEAGDVQSQMLYGSLFLDGLGVKRDGTEAARWLRKASEGGHLRAKALLARQLLDGDGVTVDAREAARLAEEPAKAGNATAALVLGIVALNGRERSRDLAEAEKWLLMAADAGVIRAFWGLAQLYGEGGDGVEADDVKSLSWIWALDPESSDSGKAGELWLEAQKHVSAEVLDAAKSLGDDHRRRIAEKAKKD